MVARLVGLGLALVGWTMALDPHLRRVILLARVPWDTPWPTLLEHPAPAALAWGVGLAALIVALVRGSSSAAGVWLAATGILAVHRITAGDATFYGGMWVAAWWWWFLRANARDADRTLRIAPRVAIFVAAALFVAPGVGKSSPGYVSGDTFAALTGDPPPLVFQALGMPPPDAYFTLLGHIGAGVELSALLWLVLPVRWSLMLVIATCGSMLVLWNVQLGSILLPVIGMAAVHLGTTRTVTGEADSTQGPAPAASA